MAINGVLFDASGTLLRVEPARARLRAVLDERGIAASDEEVRVWGDRLDAAGAVPGGTPPREVPERLTPVWRARDDSEAGHRAAFTALAREVDLPWPGLYDALYDRTFRPAAWRLYPDALEVLAALRDRGVRTAVVSNVGWDWRPVFTGLGLDPYLDAHVFSYEVGLVKPDPRIFRLACERLGLAPGEVLMVGDERARDGGAVAVGCRYLPVDHLPVTERPDALRAVLPLVAAV
ncbi:(S)-2-haloacid dehalogenase 4A [Streptomyces sp. RB5]|uniref:(S)-2-haloacid dehalogenase 4A n=1 Tax=Streptomyces smaragdinus TaxID=2585196 RepID=A0A7K0CE38_9ACTN|nr:HAD-IA family hydrolase [Streptomyces smaragdinus]MQY11738.1 (S)-2-haloacid dehalogenase 4A [Streptomyces smaragdinus]